MCYWSVKQKVVSDDNNNIISVDQFDSTQIGKQLMQCNYLCCVLVQANHHLRSIGIEDHVCWTRPTPPGRMDWYAMSSTFAIWIDQTLCPSWRVVPRIITLPNRSVLPWYSTWIVSESKLTNLNITIHSIHYTIQYKAGILFIHSS